MAKKYNLEFQPQHKKRMEFAGRFLLGFGAILLLLGVVSYIALQRDGLIDRILGQFLDPEETTQEVKSETWGYRGTAVFLVSATDNKGKELRFAALLRVDLAKREMRFTMLPTREEFRPDAESAEITLEQALEAGGLKQLVSAAQALSGQTIDRYVNSRDLNFIKAVNAMGSVTVQIPERVAYRSEAFNITISEGQQRLSGDLMLRYFRYLDALGTAGLDQQGALLRRTLESYVQARNESLLEQRFETLVNLLETDCSARDFYDCLPLLQAILRDASAWTIASNRLELGQ
jgi:hypothetical protein